MKDKSFFDTNILVYVVALNDSRSDVARNLVAEGGVISVQILNEFVTVARRKYRMSWTEVREALEDFRILCPQVVPVTAETHEAALQIAEQHGYHLYDSLVVAAAIETGCRTLYSEDMHDGHIIEGLTIRNPFGKVH